MTKKHLMISIDWFGPYSLEGAKTAAGSDYAHALYMCIGKAAYQRNSKLQYIGIGTNVSTRLVNDHHKLSLVMKDREIWLGEVSTAEPSGKKLTVTKATLDFAEWMHARFLQLPLNDKKTKGLPSRSVTVLNRWFKTDFATMRNQRPHAEWPDLLDYPDYDYPARLVWFGGKQKKLDSPSYGL